MCHMCISHYEVVWLPAQIKRLKVTLIPTPTPTPTPTLTLPLSLTLTLARPRRAPSGRSCATPSPARRAQLASITAATSGAMQLLVAPPRSAGLAGAARVTHTGCAQGVRGERDSCKIPCDFDCLNFPPAALCFDFVLTLCSFNRGACLGPKAWMLEMATNPLDAPQSAVLGKGTTEKGTSTT